MAKIAFSNLVSLIPPKYLQNFSLSCGLARAFEIFYSFCIISDVLAKHQLSFDSLCQLHNLIQFENLMPRFTATVPPCWNEMQQEQQQRRHPQHLQQQGEATQHTRTWKLQPDG